MSNLRFEVWPFPGTSPYEIKVRELPVVAASGSLPRRPAGVGSCDIDRERTRVDGTSLLDDVIQTDPDNPANDEVSTIRVFRPGDTTPIHEWLTEDPVAEADDSGLARLSGRNVEAVLDYEYVEVWDWDGSAVFQTQFPDHIYGGKNLIQDESFENPALINEVYELWNDQIGSSTFTLTMEGDTTASIAFDATASQVETAIENTTGISNCLVTGDGTEADPWVIEFVDPYIIDPDMTVADAGGLTSTLTKTTEGDWSIAPFTKSQTIARGVNRNHGTHASGSPHISEFVARTGTKSLYFNGLTQYAGVQVVLNVKPGGTYQASMWAYTSDTTTLWRLVARTPTEEFVASSTPFAGTALAADTWTQFTISDIVIPDGVTQLVLRFAAVSVGNPGSIFTDDWELKEGQAAASPGQILIDLFDDAQTDHAPTRAALTFINLDFTASLDSGSNAWSSSALAMTIKRRQSYLQMMRQFEKLGYEWRLVPTSGTPGEWDLQVFNPNGMGTDHGGADDPAIVVGQGTLPSNVTRQPPVANYLMAEGKAGLTSRVANSASIGAIGRRAQGVFDRRFTDSSELTTWVTQRLADFLAETLAPRIVIAEPTAADIWPRPLDEYDPADIIDVILADGTTRIERRIESIDYSQDTENGLIWTVSSGSAAPFVAAPGGGSASSGRTPVGYGGGSRAPVSGPIAAPVASQLRVLGTAVTAILEEYRFDEDEPDTSPAYGLGGGVPAFTVRVAAANARVESQAAADFVCTGATDQDDVPIQAALDICGSLGFGRVLLSEGDFAIALDKITVPVDVTLEGVGNPATTLHNASGVSGIAITIGATSTVRKLFIDDRTP